MSLLMRRRMMMERAEGEDEMFELIDDINTTEECTEISLLADFIDAKEVFVFISVPANATGATKNYYMTTNRELYNNNVAWLSSYTNVATGSEIHYVSLQRGIGRFSTATGMQNSDIEKVDSAGGGAAINASKSPRTVGTEPKLICSGDFVFPVGTKIQTYRR